MGPTSYAWSYAAHADHEQKVVADNELPTCYTDPATVDAWEHRRMYEMLMPLIEEFPQATWITVGDGRYGSDANFLLQHGVSAVATSLVDDSLTRAHRLGFIGPFKAMNAELIPEPDKSYDFVLCKESYHHFPRPPIAFYEMLRICRKGLVLIEPIDGPKRVLDPLKTVIKKILRKGKTSLFEPVGNFIFRVNLQEVAKMLSALNHECVAYKKFNDFWHPAFCKSRYRLFSVGAVLTRAGIAVQDLLCRLGLMNHGLATIVIFEESPSEPLRRKLRKRGFKVATLPKNPYY